MWEELLKQYREKLAAELEGKTEEEKQKILEKATDALPQEARQHVHDVGHAGATGASKSRIKSLETERDQLKTERDQLKTQLDEIKDKNPDAAAVRKEYEAKLTAKDDAIAAKEKEWQQEKQNLLVSGFTTKLKAELVALGVDSDYADVKIHNLVQAGRIKPGEDGNVSVYKSDGATPFAALSGKDLAGSLAMAEFETIDSKWKSSGVGGGAGERGGNNAPGTQSAAYFDGIRKETQESQAGTERSVNAQKNLGLPV